MNDVGSTGQCLQNLKDLTGTWPPMRVGGTTQYVLQILLRKVEPYKTILIIKRDRATYDPASSQQVTYTVSDPSQAPSSLTFGPSFMDLAAQYSGAVIMGM